MKKFIKELFMDLTLEQYEHEKDTSILTLLRDGVEDLVILHLSFPQRLLGIFLFTFLYVPFIVIFTPILKYKVWNFRRKYPEHFL